jgi:hypothetical protein
MKVRAKMCRPVYFLRRFKKDADDPAGRGLPSYSSRRRIIAEMFALSPPIV